MTAAATSMLLGALRIRRARAADADRLTDIAHAAKRHWGYPVDLIHLWTADLTIAAEFVDAHPTYAVEQGRQILGFYALSHQGGAFELEHMWIDPPHMRRGLGALLFEHAVATARSMGGSTLRIASDPYAEAFYLRMGAERGGDVPTQPAGRVLPLLIFDLGAQHGVAKA